MGRGYEKTFLQRRHTDGQQKYEKMLSTTNHQENANENSNEISLHTCQNYYYHKDNKQITHANKNEKKGNLCALLVGLKIVVATMENNMEIL